MCTIFEEQQQQHICFMKNRWFFSLFLFSNCSYWIFSGLCYFFLGFFLRSPILPYGSCFVLLLLLSKQLSLCFCSIWVFLFCCYCCCWMTDSVVNPFFSTIFLRYAWKILLNSCNFCIIKKTHKIYLHTYFIRLYMENS